jgi:hypothetical protein
MPVYFKVLDKRSAIVVGPTANVLNVVAAEADRGCPAPAPAATAASFARRLAAPCLGDLNSRGCPAPPLPRQLLREHVHGRKKTRSPYTLLLYYRRALYNCTLYVAGPPDKAAKTMNFRRDATQSKTRRKGHGRLRSLCKPGYSKHICFESFIMQTQSWAKW